MNTCIRLTFKSTFDVLYSKIMKAETGWSKFVDGFQIAQIDKHNSIMVMNVLDFEVIEAFMITDELKPWDAKRGCVDNVYSMDAIQ